MLAIRRSSGWQTLNHLATIGAFVIAASVLVFLANVVISLRHRRPRATIPGRRTRSSGPPRSPPPRHNFTALPPIRSYAPLLDLREAAEQYRAHDPSTTPAAGVPA